MPEEILIFIIAMFSAATIISLIVGVSIYIDQDDFYKIVFLIASLIFTIDL